MARRKQVEQFLRKSAQDEYVLDRLLDDENAPVEVFGFHAQQAAEKMLKAVLVAARITYPRTHRLAELIDLLRLGNIKVPPAFNELRHLTPFAVEFRYDVSFDDDSTPLDKSAIRNQVHNLRQWTLQTTTEFLSASP